MAIVYWNKKYTETLSESINRFRNLHPEYAKEKVTYAGRLDPMAEGLLILLTGEDVHRKDDFLEKDKVYEVDFCFGPKTDTYDVLGVLNSCSQAFCDFSESEIKKTLSSFLGKINQKYPPYSSRKVQGKPLFLWAKEGLLDNIEIPTKDIHIYSIDYISKTEIPISFFEKDLFSNICSVQGDFRQEKIIQSWESYFKSQACVGGNLVTHKIRVHASAGTYMRSLIDNIGTYFSCSAISIKIKRTKVGEISL